MIDVNQSKGERLRVVFFGTGEFSREILAGLTSEERVELVAVVSQIDKANARNNKVIYSPVKQFCLKNDIPLHQFRRLNTEGEEVLKSLDADLFVTASYGQIIKKNILDIPRFGTMNVHASLLPKYRGPAPIQWAIINGEKTTGITIMQTDEGMDTGDIFFSREMPISDTDTMSTLFHNLAELGVECVHEFFSHFEYYIQHHTPQDHSQSSYYPMIKKEDCILDFTAPADSICHRICGLENCYFVYKGVRYKVLTAKTCDRQGKVGEILACDSRQGLVIGAASGSVEIVTIQPESKNKMDAKSYMNSRKFTLGDRIGDFS